MISYDYKNIKPYLQNIQYEDTEIQLAFANITLFVFFTPLIFLMDLIEQADNFKVIIAVIFCPIALVMIIWSIWFIKNITKYEYTFSIYQGVTCTANSLLFLGATIKFNYIANHNKISLLFVSSYIFIYIFILYLIFSKLIKRLRTDYFLREKRINIKGIGAFSGIGIFGLLSAKFMDKILSYDANIMLLSFNMLFLSYVFEFGIHNIFRYYLICKYKHDKTIANKKDFGK